MAHMYLLAEVPMKTKNLLFMAILALISFSGSASEMIYHKSSINTKTVGKVNFNKSKTSNTNKNSSPLMALFEDLLTTPNRATAEPRVVLNAQIAPYISQVLTGNENSCQAPLEEEDFNQMVADQYLINSLLELYKVTTNENVKIKGSNLYMSILLQKIRGATEAVSEHSVKTNMSFLDGLSQSDMMVATFMSNVDSIKNLNLLIAAHQSLELPVYKVDGYIKLAVEEYKNCYGKAVSCVETDEIWNKWFVNQGFGISSPLITANMVQKGKSTVKENFEIQLNVGPFTSKELIKQLFEMINVYGGADFDYLAYLQGEELKAEQGMKGGQMNAPGKIMAGILLKLANQRLVNYYKYQRCRLLKQNSTQTNVLAQSFYNATKTTETTQPVQTTSQNPIKSCQGEECRSGTQVTSGDQSLTVAPSHPTGLHCYKDALYDGPTLIQSCPQGPNGGISCDKGKCADEGYVFINGHQKQWKGNKSGTCYANSACDSGRDCVNNYCKIRTRVTSEGGTEFLETWDDSINGFGAKVSTGCSYGYVNEGGSCINKKKCAEVPNGNVFQIYQAKSKSWGECSEYKCNEGFERDGSWKRCVQSGAKICDSSAMDKSDKDMFGGLLLNHGEKKTIYSQGNFNSHNYSGKLNKATFSCHNGVLSRNTFEDLDIQTWCSEQGSRCDCSHFRWASFSEGNGQFCEAGSPNTSIAVNLKQGEAKEIDAAPGYTGKVKLYCFLGNIQASPVYQNSGRKDYCRKN